MEKIKLINLVIKRISFHRKQFNRYRKEVNIEIKKFDGDKISHKCFNQLQYSDKRSYEELLVIDELELFKKKCNLNKIKI